MGINMAILNGNNLKLFITKNLDGNGNVATTGFNQYNTFEILLQKQSLSFSQSILPELINPSNTISTTDFNNKLAGNTLELGTLSFSCALTSGASPNDFLLWQYLVSTYSLPDRLSSTATYKQLLLNRTSAYVDTFGIIISIDNICYVIDNCKVSGVDINMALDSIVTNTWSCSFVQHKILQNTQFNTSTNAFSGGLTGTALPVSISTYKMAAGKPTKVTLHSYTGNYDHVLASTGTSIKINNQLDYISTNGLNSIDAKPLFVGAKDFNISGNLGIYARSSGSSESALITRIVNDSDYKEYSHLYSITVEIVNGNTKICDIIIDGCSVASTSTLDAAVIHDVSFELRDSQYKNNCAIKFYV